MYWRIIVTCLLLCLCSLQSAQGSKNTHSLEESAKTSDFLFDDEDLALADQASGSGPVSAPDLDDVNEDDVIDEEDVSVLESKPTEVTSTTTTTAATPEATPQQPVTPKVSAVASKPEPQPPASRFDDIDIGSGSGDGDTGENYDDEDDDVDDISITGEGPDEEDAEDTEETTQRNANPIDTRVVQQGSTPAPAPPSVEPPREENQIPVVTGPPSSSGPALPPTDNNETGNGGAHVLGHKPDDRPVSFFSQPGILAAVVGGAVVGLLCAILLVMFIVYRMRKKDEGSYALDEPKRSPNSYAYNKNSREFFA